MSTHYVNAREYLPPELIDRILACLPADRRERVLLYVHTDYYGPRDAQVVAAFERALQDERFHTLTEIYEALGRMFALSSRRIWSIVRQGRTEPAVRVWRRRRVQRPGRPRRVRRTPTVGRGRRGPGRLASTAARRDAGAGDGGES